MLIRPALDQDIDRLTEIYNWYILHSTATFELAPIQSQEMQQRVQQKRVEYDWLVTTVDDQVVGYGYYGAYHARAAYHHTVELSIYLDQRYHGQGLGKALYRALVQSAQSKGFRELVSIITLPNPSSIALHQRFGFQEVGVLKQVGYKFGQYLDVGIWQASIAPDAVNADATTTATDTI